MGYEDRDEPALLRPFLGLGPRTLEKPRRESPPTERIGELTFIAEHDGEALFLRALLEMVVRGEPEKLTERLRESFRSTFDAQGPRTLRKPQPEPQKHVVEPATAEEIREGVGVTPEDAAQVNKIIKQQKRHRGANKRHSTAPLTWHMKKALSLLPLVEAEWEFLTDARTRAALRRRGLVEVDDDMVRRTDGPA